MELYNKEKHRASNACGSAGGEPMKRGGRTILPAPAWLSNCLAAVPLANRYGSDPRLVLIFDQLVEFVEKECQLLDNVPRGGLCGGGSRLKNDIGIKDPLGSAQLRPSGPPCVPRTLLHNRHIATELGHGFTELGHGVGTTSSRGGECDTPTLSSSCGAEFCGPFYRGVGFN
ncbi:hypothetical protein EVAR_7346_1 [Eumeta japonica]|uniref:Uncharacterized protein n=1 Tax=Eumeta variegata TaxID=151549 RepID=A0A4C1T687_EUMVA|nr:hypothetical protein EVAR_7346_1 [Eumeta japonica]